MLVLVRFERGVVAFPRSACCVVESVPYNKVMRSHRAKMRLVGVIGKTQIEVVELSSAVEFCLYFLFTHCQRVEILGKLWGSKILPNIVTIILEMLWNLGL